MKNVALGRKTLDWIEAHPEEVEMKVWGKETACGTVACLAGHALIQDGYLIDGSDFYRPEPEWSFVSYVGMEARERLGLTADEYYGDDRDGYENALFDDDQDTVTAIVRFRRIVERSEAALEEARHA